MLNINSSIQKTGTLSVQNADGTVKQVAYLSATIGDNNNVSMSASFNDFKTYLENDTALDIELKNFLESVKATYKTSYATPSSTTDISNTESEEN